jgi:predicted PurR-regulated permease PerM
MTPEPQPHFPGFRESINRRLLNGVLWLILIVTTIVILREGKDVFIPLVIALVAVYLVTILSRLVQRISIRGRHLPSLVTMILSFAFIFGVGYALFKLVAENALLVAEAAPGFQSSLMRVQRDVFSSFGMEEPMEAREIIRNLDLQSLFTVVATTLAGVLGKISLVILYSLFILIELRHLDGKLKALFPDPARRETILNILKRIDSDIHKYLGVKTAVSIITALLSYGVMRSVGLQFAEFWALLVFILNYIPTIGSIAATVLPTLLAMVQFTTLGPILVVGLGILAIQQLMGNVLEPNLMGETLNISPLVVFCSLIVWGSIWGVVGMFLCVPITVTLIIILSNFDSTRWVSILLSKSGRARER